MKSIKERSYEKYQMHWMFSHGITVADIGRRAEKWRIEKEEYAYMCRSFPDFLNEIGINGSIWACYDEFLKNEYMDRAFMHQLLTEEEWKEYLSDIGDGYITYEEAVLFTEECIKEGILQETDSHIFIWRETGWYLEPKEMVAKDLMYDKNGRDILMAALNAKKKGEAE